MPTVPAGAKEAVKAPVNAAKNRLKRLLGMEAKPAAQAADLPPVEPFPNPIETQSVPKKPEAPAVVTPKRAKPGQTVSTPERMAFPGIYKRPDVVAKEAAERVAPESPNLKELFGVTREDLFQIARSREGNLPGNLPGLADNPKGMREGAEQITNKRNTQRLLDANAEAENYPELVRGMDAWYVMDPLYQKMAKELGPERAKVEYDLMNKFMGMASPGSEVTTEIPRGTAAYYLYKQGRFPEFVDLVGLPASQRGVDFPQDLLTVPGHVYHSTAQAKPMQRFVETGEMDMSSPKVPMYIEASGVPEVGFQTKTPVGDAHWSRAVGLADIRKSKNPGKSVSNSEMYSLAPWWREKIAGELGIEPVSAQGRTWGVFSPQTGVTTPIGAPKLELIADQVVEAARRMNITPQEALQLFIRGEARLGKKEGGAVRKFNDGGLAAMEQPQEQQPSQQEMLAMRILDMAREMGISPEEVIMMLMEQQQGAPVAGGLPVNE